MKGFRPRTVDVMVFALVIAAVALLATSTLTRNALYILGGVVCIIISGGIVIGLPKLLRSDRTDAGSKARQQQRSRPEQKRD